MARLNRAPALVLLLGAATGACTTVRIEERHAFDNKRTVDLAALRAEGVHVDEVRLRTEDGTALSMRHFRVAEPRGTVLYYGGNGFLMATAHDVLEALLAVPLDVVMFDYRGYGRSEGAPSVAALEADALEVYGWVTQTASVPPDRLLVHGHSLGSFVGTYVVNQRPAAGLFLESPVTDVEDLLERLTPWLARLLVRFDIDDALLGEKNGARVEQLDLPAWFVVGADDEVSPKEMAETLYELAPKTIDKRLVILPDRGHNDLPLDAAYLEAYRDFAEEVLGTDGWDDDRGCPLAILLARGQVSRAVRGREVGGRGAGPATSAEPFGAVRYGRV